MAVVTSASTRTTIVMIAPTFMDQAAALGHDVVLTPPLIPRDTMKGAAGLATIPEQQQLWSLMPSQVSDNHATSPPQLS